MWERGEGGIDLVGKSKRGERGRGSGSRLPLHLHLVLLIWGKGVSETGRRRGEVEGMGRAFVGQWGRIVGRLGGSGCQGSARGQSAHGGDGADDVPCRRLLSACKIWLCF